MRSEGVGSESVASEGLVNGVAVAVSGEVRSEGFRGVECMFFVIDIMKFGIKGISYSSVTSTAEKQQPKMKAIFFDCKV